MHLKQSVNKSNTQKGQVMTLEEQKLAVFQSQVRELLDNFKRLRQENEELYEMIGKNEDDIKRLQAELDSKTDDFEKLKMARMISLSDNDIEETKERLSKLIRDVNKCISILTETK